jgi:HEAT repeat protein
VIELLPARGAGGLEDRVWDELASAGTVRGLLEQVPPDVASVDALLPHLRGDALEPLFDLLLHSEDRRVRRAMFDRLRQTGSDGGALALARMVDEPWYVPRNLLALLAETKELPTACDPSPWLAHPDSRVRREALRVALRIEKLREPALAAALADGDEHVLRTALTAAIEYPSPATGRPLAEIAARETLDGELRAAAIDALVRGSRSRPTLEVLLRIAAGDARLPWWPARQPTRSRAVAGALRALATHWPDEPRAVALLRRAAASPDHEIRLAAKAVKA